MPSMPTQIGPYQIEREIGGGGMGMVYLGRHTENGRVAAVKVLQVNLASDDAFVARFEREADALKKLSNAHIVEFFETGIDNHTHYLAMEYVDGETLSERILSEGRLPWRTVVGITQQICTALKAAHDTGIVHRDLKPSNLLITREGFVKLTDFGVAQMFAANSLTVTGGIVGTAEYMSPEQAQGSKATKKSDLYSLGAVMYVMLTGRPPFRGRTHIDIIQKQRYGQFDRPIRYAEDMPVWLDDIVCQLLEKDPDKRIPDAYVLYRRLDEVLRKVALTDSGQERGGSDTVILEGSENVLSETLGASEVAPERLRGPGAGTMMRHVLLEELREPSDTIWSRLSNNPWFLAFCLLLLIFGGVLWFRAKEPAAEELFENGVALMKSSDSNDWLRARDEFFQPLLKMDREKWTEKVEPYLSQIEAYEMQREYSPGRVRLKRVRPKTEFERILAMAHHYESIGDLTTAERLLRTLEPLLEGAPENQHLLEVTRERIAEIQHDRSSDPSRFHLVESSLKRANAHFEAGEYNDAQRICESVLELYDGQPDADKYVQQASELLEKLKVTANNVE